MNKIHKAVEKLIYSLKILIFFYFLILFSIPGYAKDFFYKSDNQDDKFCQMIEEILNDPVNEDFGDWFGAWEGKRELQTSEFKITEKYKDKIAWVKWKEIPNEKAMKFFKEEWIDKFLPIEDKKLLLDKDSYEHGFLLEEADINVPNENNSFKFIRLSFGHRLDGLPRCFFPNRNPDLRLDPEYIDYSSLREEGQWKGYPANYPILSCGLFNYGGELYHSHWTKNNRGVIDLLGSDNLSISTLAYLKKERKIEAISSKCFFTRDYIN